MTSQHMYTSMEWDVPSQTISQILLQLRDRQFWELSLEKQIGQLEKADFCQSKSFILLPDQFVTLVVGAGNDTKEFLVHKDITCFSSPVLKAAFNSESIEGQKLSYKLENVEFEVFQLFLRWMYKQDILYHLTLKDCHLLERAQPNDPPEMTKMLKVVFKKLDSKVHGLVQLWILADRLLIPRLQNLAMKLLLEIVSMKEINKTLKGEWIHIYENTTTGSPLRKLVFVACALLEDLPAEADCEHLPRQTILDIARYAMAVPCKKYALRNRESQRLYFYVPETQEQKLEMRFTLLDRRAGLGTKIAVSGFSQEKSATLGSSTTMVDSFGRVIQEPPEVSVICQLSAKYPQAEETLTKNNFSGAFPVNLKACCPVHGMNQRCTSMGFYKDQAADANDPWQYSVWDSAPGEGREGRTKISHAESNHSAWPNHDNGAGRDWGNFPRAGKTSSGEYDLWGFTSGGVEAHGDCLVGLDSTWETDFC